MLGVMSESNALHFKDTLKSILKPRQRLIRTWATEANDPVLVDSTPECFGCSRCYWVKAEIVEDTEPESSTVAFEEN